MAYMNFVEALMSAKRRAQLQGRPLSQQEATGISEGYARGARETAIQEQGMELQEKGLAQQSSQFSQSLAQRKFEESEKMRIAEEERKHQKMRGIASGVGSVVGGVVGGIYGQGYGAVAGAGVGSQAGAAMYEIDPLQSVANKIFGSCIIISSCTSPHSYEVEVAREYRDKYMDEPTLFGYYFLCALIVPAIRRFSVMKAIFKKVLVDSLVDWGEMMLGKKEKCRLIARIISESFLGFCSGLGKALNRKLEVA
jgi:hypothetical protein